MMKESPISREGWSKVIPRLTISVWMMKVFYGSRTACYVVECDTCRRVKTDHMRPIRLLQPLNIPAWKWEDISMDLIVGLPISLTPSGQSSTGLSSLLISFQCTPTIGLKSMLNCVLLASCVCMVRPRPSFLIEGPSSLLISGSNCMLPWDTSDL
jgi:hypothetical protein